MTNFLTNSSHILCFVSDLIIVVHARNLLPPSMKFYQPDSYLAKYYDSLESQKGENIQQQKSAD